MSTLSMGAGTFLPDGTGVTSMILEVARSRRKLIFDVKTKMDLQSVQCKIKCRQHTWVYLHLLKSPYYSEHASQLFLKTVSFMESEDCMTVCAFVATPVRF